jgi:hypothetical protein
MKKLLIFLLPIILFCCKEEDSVNNIAILISDSSSILINSKGFSFSQGRVIDYPNENQIIPDFKVFVGSKLNKNDVIYTAWFSSLVYKPTFIFVDSLSTPQEADHLFAEYIPDSYIFEQNQTMPFVNENQIWLVKSIENEYYMIQILELTYGSNPKYNIEKDQRPEICTVTFKWKPV